MSDDVLDGTIVARDETEPDVALRLARIAERPAMISIYGPSGKALAPVDAAVFDQDAELFIGFYNKSGSRPSPDDFMPAAKWSDADRTAIGLPKSGRRIGMPLTSLARPFRAADRIAIGALVRRGGHEHYVTTVNVRADIPTNYITHFTIGRRDGRILFAGVFDHAMPVLGGHTVKFGIELGAPALPEAHGPRPALPE